MIKRLISAVLLAALTLPAMDASEDEKARPNKEEIGKLILQFKGMPAQEQNAKLAGIIAGQDSSKTPRSDFLLCTGLAYLGNYRAQICVARAFEKGIGIVEDLSEAYTWYAVASESRISDEAEAQKVETERENVKEGLISAYPHPTEDELVDMVEAQKTRIAQYQETTQKSKKQ
jgi:hypothetical protein